MMKILLFSFILASLTVPAVFAAEPTATTNNPVGAVAQMQPPVQKNQVHGQIVDEKGKPVPGAAWKIAGTEVLRDGKWTRVIRLGVSIDAFADADGRFVISYGEPIRFDLQFHHPGFAPEFLYEIGADSPDLKVTLKRGERIHGKVTQNVNGKKMAVAGKIVELRLGSQDLWFQEQVLTDAAGKFEFRACTPPDEPPLPPGNVFGPGSNQDPPPKRKWQLVCDGKVVEVDVRNGHAVETVNLEGAPPTDLNQ